MSAEINPIPDESMYAPLMERKVCSHCKVFHSSRKIDRLTNEIAKICMKADFEKGNEQGWVMP